MLVDKADIRCAALWVGVSNIEGYLVLLVEVIPDSLCKSVDISGYTDAFGLSNKGGERISVGNVGMYKMTES